MIGMELIPALELGWFNGWILLCLYFLIYGLVFLIFPKNKRASLFIYDNSHWDKRQRFFYNIGRILTLVLLVLIIFSRLKVGSLFIFGIILYSLGLVGFIMALLNFKDTLPDTHATKGLYRISRHPQELMLFITAIGMCIAIGSWLALFILVLTRLFVHFRNLAEEEACLERYGDSYRAYMECVPRYFLIKTHRKAKDEKTKKH